MKLFAKKLEKRTVIGLCSVAGLFLALIAFCCVLLFTITPTKAATDGKVYGYIGSNNDYYHFNLRDKNSSSAEVFGTYCVHLGTALNSATNYVRYYSTGGAADTNQIWTLMRFSSESTLAGIRNIMAENRLTYVGTAPSSARAAERFPAASQSKTLGMRITQDLVWTRETMDRPDLYPDPPSKGYYSFTQAEKDYFFDSGLYFGQSGQPVINTTTGQTNGSLAAGPFKIDWSAGSATAIKRLNNDGPNKDKGPWLTYPKNSTYRVTSDINGLNEIAQFRMGTTFYVQLTTPNPVKITFSLVNPMITSLKEENLFYYSGKQEQYNLKYNFFTGNFEVKVGKDSPPPEDPQPLPIPTPVITKYVTAYNGSINGDYKKHVDLSPDSKGLFKMTITCTNDGGLDLIFLEKPQGVGTVADPIRIYSTSQLAEIGRSAQSMKLHYKLMNSIDLTSHITQRGGIWQPIGSETPGRPDFSGSLVGSTSGSARPYIKGLSMVSSAKELGLFLSNAGTISDIVIDAPNINSSSIDYIHVGAVAANMTGGTIKNVAVINGTLNTVSTASSNDSGGASFKAVGGIVGSLRGGVVDGCTVRIPSGVQGYGQTFTGSATAAGIVENSDGLGGIAGATVDATIKNCVVSATPLGKKDSGGTVVSLRNLAGITGAARYSTIDNCYVGDGTTLLMRKESSYCSGIVGRGIGLTINKCTVSNVDIAGTAYSTNWLGGILSGSFGGTTLAPTTITKCSYTGNITGGICLGGMVGYSTAATPVFIKECKSSGSIYGYYTSTGNTNSGGGMAGRLNGGAQDCWSNMTIQNVDVGGIAGQFVPTYVDGQQCDILRCFYTGTLTSYQQHSSFQKDTQASGGIAGWVSNANGYIRDCVVANATINNAYKGTPDTANKETLYYTQIGRINGDSNGGLLDNNKAYNVTLRRSTNNTNNFSETVWPTSNASGKDGADISAAAVTTQSTYTNWNFSSIWQMGGSGPVLRNAGATVGYTAPTQTSDATRYGAVGAIVYDYYATETLDGSPLTKSFLTPANYLNASLNPLGTASAPFFTNIPSKNGTYTFYYRTDPLPVGHYPNVVSLRPGNDDDADITVTDTPDSIGLRILKYSESTLQELNGATFSLYKYASTSWTSTATPVQSNFSVIMNTTNNDGYVVNGLTDGYYRLDETNVVPNHQDNRGNPYYIIVNGTSATVYRNTNYLNGESLSFTGGTVNLFDVPVVNMPVDPSTKQLQIEKYKPDGSTKALNSEFTVWAHPDNTFSQTQKVLQGVIMPTDTDFSYIDLPIGFYTMQETKAADDCNLDSATYYITVTAANITVEDRHAATDPLKPVFVPAGTSSGSGSSYKTVATHSAKILLKAKNEETKYKLVVEKWNEDGTIKLDKVAVFSVKKASTSSFAAPYTNVGTVTCNDPATNYIELPVGYYIMTETQAPDYYKLDSTEYWITVSSAGITVVDKHDTSDKVPYISGVQDLRATVTHVAANDPNPAYTLIKAKNKLCESDLKVEKYAPNGTTAVKATFELTKQGDASFVKTLDTDSTTTTIPDSITLTPGTYYLKETSVQVGYEKDETPYTIVVTNTISVSGGPAAPINAVYVGNATASVVVKAKNNMSSEMTVKKVDEKGNPLNGAEFQVDKYAGPGYTGTLTNKGKITITTGGSGSMLLEDGYYKVTEIKAPDNYELDSTPYNVTVADGKFTAATDTHESIDPRKATITGLNTNKLTITAVNIETPDDTKVSIKKVLVNQAGNEPTAEDYKKAGITYDPNWKFCFELIRVNDDGSLHSSGDKFTMWVKKDETRTITGIPYGKYLVVETVHPHSEFVQFEKLSANAYANLLTQSNKYYITLTQDSATTAKEHAEISILCKNKIVPDHFEDEDGEENIFKPSNIAATTTRYTVPTP